MWESVRELKFRASGRRPRIFYGWTVVLACAGMFYYGAGTFFYGFGTFFNLIREHFA